MRTETGQIFHLEDYTPTDFIVERIDLTFELAPEETKVVARSIFKRRDNVAPDAPLVLVGDELKLDALRVDSTDVASADYDASSDLLEVRNLPASDAFELTVETTLSPQTNTQLMGLYRTNGNYCTQCESEGFRRITYFYDRPDVLTIYTVTIIADKSVPHLLSNGNFLGRGNYDETRHFATWFDPHPKPSYLFALVACDLGMIDDTFVTMSGRKVRLNIYVEHGTETSAAYAMDALKRSMRWDEETYGREYDLDIFMIVAVSDFNMGAMENKGLNVFNDKYVLADPETATDQDYANIETIIAHEYFHNWTGNRITCRDWFQLCLKEGLTVYRDHTFSQDQRSAAVKRIAEIKALKAHQFPEDAGPLAHPVRPSTYKEINNFYTSTVYEKGSEVVGMIRTIVGETDFRSGMTLYFDRHDGQAVTIEDFVTCFAEKSGHDLSQFMLWYSQAGTPLVSVSTQYDAGTKGFTVTLEQSVSPTPGQPNKEPMHIPLRFGLLLPDGSEAPVKTSDKAVRGDVVHLTARNQEIRFDGVKERPVLSINRGFSAPVNIAMSQSAADLAHIARHDSDGVSRWQAINSCASSLLVLATGHLRDERMLPPVSELADILITVASDDSLEPAFRAQALQLPGEADIAREIGNNIDPEAIYLARQQAMTEVARKGIKVFVPLVDLAPTGDYSPNADDAGKRALAAIALHYVSLAENSPTRALAAYETANNMTVMAASLQILSHLFAGSDEAESALADFEKKFSDNPLVLDKWFSIQAMAPGAAALDKVMALRAHAHFERKNPNRVRALIGAFSAGNPTGFNRKDGAGFRLLAEEVLAIDPANPQLAARLLTALRSWRSLESDRQEQARLALVEIHSAKTLSTDVRDIVERTLQ